MGSFKECVEQINRKINNFINDFDKLENRVSCCEVYASIETGDAKKWEQVLRLIKNQLPQPYPDERRINRMYRKQEQDNKEEKKVLLDVDKNKNDSDKYFGTFAPIIQRIEDLDPE